LPRNQRRIPVLSTLPTAYFVNGDTGQKKTSNQAWGNKFFDAEELAVIIPIPEAVLDDVDYDIWAEVKPRLMEAFGLAFDQAVLFGTNAPASWPTNLLAQATNSGNIVTLGTGVDLYDDLLGENGTFSLVEKDGFMCTGCIADTSMRGKYRGLRDANKQPIFKALYKEGVQGATNYELDGCQVNFPLNGSMDATKAFQFCGDFKQLVYAMRQDVTYKILTEAFIQDNAGAIIYNLAQQDMVALRAVMRLAWQVPNPINRLNTNEATRYPFAVLKPAGV
jgi:HK97 family phage major capsid protein